MKKKLVSTFLCIILVLSAFPMTAFGADIASGTGWNIDSAGCLHITGAIKNPSYVDSDGFYVDQVPWKNYRSSIKKVIAETGSSINNGTSLFNDYYNLTELDITKLGTSAVTSMRGMFINCDGLTSINLSSNNLSNVTTMQDMFFNCDNLEKVYLPSLSNSKVTNLHGVFNFCKKLKTLNISNFDTSKATDMSYMFAHCLVIETLDLSNFNTSNVENMEKMFYECNSLKTLNISNFSTEKLTNSASFLNLSNCIEEISLNGNIIQEFAYTLTNIHPKWINKTNSQVYTNDTELKGITGKVTLNRAYDIVVNIEGNGTVTKNKNIAAKGQQITLTPNPASDAVFDKWESSDVVVSGNKFIMPDKKVTVKAVFKTHPHSYTQQVATAKYLKSAATCTSKAVYYKSCTCGLAGAATFEYGSPKGHSPTFVNGKPATATEDGYKGYYSCVCGKYFENSTCTVEITDLEAWKADGGNGYLEHEGHKVFTVLNLKEGETHIGTIHVSPEGGPYLPGTVITLTATPAEGYHHSGFWGEFGFSTGLVITGNTFIMPDYDVFIGTAFEKHTWDEGVITTPATCVKKGVMTYTCKCGVTKTESIAEIPHSFSNYVSNNDATCVTNGTKTAVCDNGCGTTDTIVDTTVPTGHNPVTYVMPATTKADGIEVVKCSNCDIVISQTTINAAKTVTLKTTKYTYNGKAKKPAVTVTDSLGQIIAPSNYEVVYPKGRKNVGTYTCVINFKGNYSGTAKKSFTIVPKGTTITSLTAKSKGFTMKYKVQPNQTDGYQIQISTDSKFKKDVKSFSFSKNSKVPMKNTKLKPNKKYYVRIRTYKTVKGKKYYSSWSGSKTVIKKK